MSYDKKKLAKYMSILVQNTTDNYELVDKDTHFSILSGGGTRFEITNKNGHSFSGQTPDDGLPTLFIMKDGVQSLEDFVNECLKDRSFAIQIGGETLTKHVTKVLQHIHPKTIHDLDLDDLVKNNVIQALRADIKHWSVRVPINNLTLTMDFKIGTVTFACLDNGVVANTKLIMDHHGTDEINTVSNQAALLKVVNEIASQGTAWATVEIDAHEGRLKEAASQHIEASINLIRAFTHIFNPHSLRSAFGLPYELSSGMTGFIGQTEKRFSIQMDRRGYFVPFELDDNKIKYLREHCYFDELARIAGENWDNLNSFERAIRISFHWLGRSVIASTLAESFTHCAIAIERLLIIDNEQTTVERFADRITYLIANTPEERMGMHKAAKRLYDIRSKIVHAGFESIELHQFAELEHLAISALVHCASLIQEINDHRGLTDLLHQRKMT